MAKAIRKANVAVVSLLGFGVLFCSTPTNAQTTTSEDTVSEECLRSEKRLEVGLKKLEKMEEIHAKFVELGAKVLARFDEKIASAKSNAKAKGTSAAAGEKKNHPASVWMKVKEKIAANFEARLKRFEERMAALQAKVDELSDSASSACGGDSASVDETTEASETTETTEAA